MNPPLKKVKTVKNAEDTKTFCDKFFTDSEELEYIYLGDTGDDSETCNIDFVI